MNPLNQLDPTMITAVAMGLAAIAVLVITVRIVRRIARAVRSSARRASGSRFGFGVAVTVALGVAGVGGVTSFEAVSAAFGSPLVPLVADGMIIACTALRLAAMSRGWRIPGAMFTTYVFIAGSVIINAASVEGWAAKLGHALAPLAYAVLVEMLAHLLRLHMGLVQPPAARRLSALMSTRWSALTWLTSPVITTRAWLHLARTGGTDPVAARALMQQLVRMSSRLSTVCPSPASLPAMVRARAARTAALHTIRDGLLTARDVALLLPTSGQLSPADLLALIDRAALGLPADHATMADFDPAADGRAGGPVRPAAALAVHRPASVTASAPVHPAASTAAPAAASESSAPAAPDAPDESAPADAADSAPADADDAALVAFLHRHSAEHNDGQPLAIREVQRLLSSGWSKAKRLHALTDWTDTEPDEQPTSLTRHERQLQLITSSADFQSSDLSESQETRA